MVLANAEANPAMSQFAPEAFVGTVMEKWTEKEFIRFGIENQNWMLSQFMHGEQGALLCTAKIVETVRRGSTPSTTRRPRSWTRPVTWRSSRSTSMRSSRATTR